jgi:type I restriction enzyme, S subunit
VEGRELTKVATLQRGYDLPYRVRKPGVFPIVTSSGIADTHAEARVVGPGVVTGRYGTIGEVFFMHGDFWPLNTTLFVKNFHGTTQCLYRTFCARLTFIPIVEKAAFPV